MDIIESLRKIIAPHGIIESHVWAAVGTFSVASGASKFLTDGGVKFVHGGGNSLPYKIKNGHVLALTQIRVTGSLTGGTTILLTLACDTNETPTTYLQEFIGETSNSNLHSPPLMLVGPVNLHAYVSNNSASTQNISYALMGYHLKIKRDGNPFTKDAY